MIRVSTPVAPHLRLRIGGSGDSPGVYKVSYWLFAAALAVLTIGAFRYTVMNGWTAKGMVGLAITLVSFAVFLAFTLSMRDRDRRSPPIAR